MSLRYYANAPATTLTASCTAVDTTIEIASTAGLPIQYPYTLILDRGLSTEEAVSVTNAAGTTLTVTRGIDSTTAFAHSIGGSVVHGITAQDIREPNTHINATSGVHGVTGDLVGETDAQTLTNKDLSSGTNVFPAALATDAEVATAEANAEAYTDAHAADTSTHGVATVAGLAEAQTFTNKTIDLTDNTVTGTTAEFNAANSDGDFATLAGTETLTNKTLADPVVTGVGETRFINKSVSETVVSSITPQDDDELQFSVEANAVYTLDVVILWEASVASGLLYVWTGPAGVSFNGISQIGRVLDPSGDVRILGWSEAANPSLDGGGAGIGDPLPLLEHYQIRTSSAGTVKFQWAQSVSHATNTRVKLNSYLVVRRVA